MNLHEPWIKRLAGTPGVVLAFVWGFAEGTFFFVIPDVTISLVALLEPRRAWRHILAAIAGASLGGALLFSWAVRDASSAQHAVASVRFVTARMIAMVHTSYETHGIGAVFLGPLSGIPYKLYAVDAPQFVSEPAFLVATIPARGERFVLIWVVFGALGAFLRRFPALKPRQLAILHGTVWILFYLFYWGRIAFR